MPKTAKRLSANEMLKILDNQWLTTKDIKLLGCISLTRAREVREEIVKVIKEKDENFFLPEKLVPSEKVIEYFHLDLTFLKKMASNNGCKKV